MHANLYSTPPAVSYVHGARHVVERWQPFVVDGHMLVGYVEVICMLELPLPLHSRK